MKLPCWNFNKKIRLFIATGFFYAFRMKIIILLLHNVQQQHPN